MWAAGRRAGALPFPPESPASIFVLRNNDVGDLLAATPLFDALHRRFPASRIVAGVGPWNLDVLRHNPHVAEAIGVDAPWFNKYAGERGALGRLAWILRAPAAAEVARRRFAVGIDVLGSVWGSLLLVRAGIPYRLGVRGYAGGYTAMQATVPFDPEDPVGRTALRFAEALGATDLPPARPQLFLTAEERATGERAWQASGTGRRIVLGPGGGLDAKRWPLESFAALLAQFGDDVRVLVLGGLREREEVAALAARSPRAWHLPDPPGLRETFALVAAADGVICNSSMLLHVAAAFEKPAVVLLGPAFPSARQHQAQWGYPGLCRSLGREEGLRETLATPDEARQAVREVLGV